MENSELINLEKLAISLREANKLTEAITLEEKIVKSYTELYSKDPNKWAEYYTRALNNLAVSYYNQRRKADEEIKDMTKKAYIISSKYLGENHQHTQNMKNGYDYVLRELKKN